MAVLTAGLPPEFTAAREASRHGAADRDRGLAEGVRVAMAPLRGFGAALEDYERTGLRTEADTWDAVEVGRRAAISAISGKGSWRRLGDA